MNVFVILNIFRLAQIEENRKRIKPIIDCIILCGREDLALRGHKDFGSINIDGKLKLNKVIL